jgi:hypothetical protein
MNRKQLINLIAIFTTTIALNLNAQSFDRFKDNANQFHCIRYYKIDNQLVVEKRIPFDTTLAVYYVIGIYVSKMQLPFVDTFMRSGGTITLTRGTKIYLKEEISTLNFGHDMGRAAIKHQLTGEELKFLTSEPIQYFTIIGIKKEFDKLEGENILKAINNLLLEKY